MDDIYYDILKLDYVVEAKRYDSGVMVWLKGGHQVELDVRSYPEVTHVRIRTIQSDIRNKFMGCAILKYDKCFVFEDGVYLSDTYFMDILKERLGI